MDNTDLTELKEGLKKVERKTIISAGASEKGEKKSKIDTHLYISSDLWEKLRDFQVKNWKEFPRISYVVEEALREFLKDK